MASAHLREVIVRAVENVSDIVEITDDQGRLQYVNQAFEERTGWTSDEVLGQTPASFLRSGEHDQQYYDEIWETISNGEPWQGRMTSQAKDGHQIIQEVFITPMQDASGAITHYVAIKREITERVQLEGQLLKADRLAAVGRLAAGVAHEINNPLTYVLANLDFVRHRLESLEISDDFSETDASGFVDELREILDETSSGAAQIRDIVRSLGAMTLSNKAFGEVDVVEVIDFSRRLVDHEVGHHVDVVADYADVPSVWGNRSQLTQVFVNLLANAVQAIDGEKDNHEVCVTGWSEDEHAVVQIKDNGAGMSAEVVERAFEPFYTTKEVGDGTGLGLSICYGIVTSMNGTIDVQSENGVGTTFEVRLPTADHAMDVSENSPVIDHSSNDPSSTDPSSTDPSSTDKQAEEEFS